MKTPSQEQIAERAYQLWLEQGRPSGHEVENWFEAERQLAAGRSGSDGDTEAPANSGQASESAGESALTRQLKAETAAESTAEFHISPPVPEEVAIKAALQKKSARAPKIPTKSAPNVKPPETGKPLWSHPAGG